MHVTTTGFDFTWLQHTASHLVFLSVPGHILFALMLANHDFLHPLRPLCSIVVMIWTFIMLLNWKTPANLIAYRWGTMNYARRSRPATMYKTKSRVETVAEVQHFVSLDYLLHCGHVDPDLWDRANRDLQLAQYLNTNADEKFEWAMIRLLSTTTIITIFLLPFVELPLGLVVTFRRDSRVDCTGGTMGRWTSQSSSSITRPKHGPTRVSRRY